MIGNKLIGEFIIDTVMESALLNKNSLSKRFSIPQKDAIQRRGTDTHVRNEIHTYLPRF